MRYEHLGGWYCAAAPGGQWTSLIPSPRAQQPALRIDTDRGVVDLPGEGVLYLDLLLRGGRTLLTGQGWNSNHAWLYDSIEWSEHGPAFGMSPCIFDSGRDALLVSVDGQRMASVPLAGGAPTVTPLNMGVEGLAYVQADGTIVTGGSVYAGWNGVHNRTDFGNVAIGQGSETGCVVRFADDGVLRLLEPGPIRFVRVQRTGPGGRYAIAMVRQGANYASVFHFVTEAELRALPPVSAGVPMPAPVPVPVPVPLPIPEPTPMSIPDHSVFVARRWRELGLQPKPFGDESRAQSHAFCVRIAKDLNALERSTAWGTLHKPHGNRWQDESIDFIVFDDGREQIPHVDILTNADGMTKADDPDGQDHPPTGPTWDTSHGLVDRDRFVLRLHGGDGPDPGDEDPVRHVYDGGDNDTGTCDICGQPRAADVHNIVNIPPPVNTPPEQPAPSCDCAAELAKLWHHLSVQQESVNTLTRMVASLQIEVDQLRRLLPKLRVKPTGRGWLAHSHDLEVVPE